MQRGTRAAPGPARRSPADQARLRRQALHAAAAIFAAEGGDALSIRRVADALSVGATSLYRHFPSKVHLLRDVWDELLVASFRAALNAADACSTPHEKPAAFVDGFIGHWIEHPQSYLIVFTTGNERLAAQHGLAPYGHEAAVQRHFEALAQFIERGCPRRLAADEVDALLELMICRTFGLLHSVLYFASYPWRDIAALRREVRVELVQRMATLGRGAVARRRL